MGDKYAKGIVFKIGGEVSVFRNNGCDGEVDATGRCRKLMFHLKKRFKLGMETSMNILCCYKFKKEFS